MTVAVVVVIVAGAAGAYAATRGAPTRFRLAAVSKGSVVQSLLSEGAVTPVHEGTASFPVAGTVAQLPVAVGSQVRAGQTLAVLDTASLQQTVASNQAVLATAEARVATDQNGQLTAATPTTTSTRSSTSRSSSTSTVNLAGLAGRQAAVRAAQTTADRELTSSQLLLRAAEQACGAPVSGAGAPSTTPGGSRHGPHAGAPSPTPTTSATPSPSPTATPAAPGPPRGARPTSGPPAATSTPSATSTPPASSPPAAPTSAAVPASGPGSPACLGGLQASLTQQQLVNKDLQGLSAAITQLATRLSSALSAAGATGSAKGTGSTAGSGSSAGAGAGAGGSGGAGVSAAASSATPVGVPSALQLAADQASVDAANAQVRVADQQLSRATLTSPMDGTVAAVGLTVGQRVGAGSGTATVVVVAPGGEQASASVSDAAVDQVRVGLPALVTPAAGGPALNGTVTAIGLVGVASSSGTVSFPVTIALAAGARGLPNGAAVSIAIQVSQVDGVLTVPSSAVRNVGSRSVVQVLRAGKSTPVLVTLGARGSLRTQVLSGLGIGDQVILADLTTPLPTATTTNLRRLGGGGQGTVRRGAATGAGG